MKKKIIAMLTATVVALGIVVTGFSNMVYAAEAAEEVPAAPAPAEEAAEIVEEAKKEVKAKPKKKEKGGAGRTVLKVLLIILIIIFVIELAGIAIKWLAPDSSAAEAIDNQLNKIIHLITGDEPDYNISGIDYEV